MRLGGRAWLAVGGGALALLALAGNSRAADAPLSETAPVSSTTPLGADPEGPWTRGRLDLRYVFRTTPATNLRGRESDQDLFQDLFVEGGYGTHARYELSLRVHEDIDGHARVSAFRDVWDTYRQPYRALVYTGYVEGLDLGPVARVRVGRQYYGEGVEVRFDGLLVETQPLADAFRMIAFGGLPAYLYESSVRHDWLAGGGIEIVAIPRTTIHLDYVHVTDQRPDLARLVRNEGVARELGRDSDFFIGTVRARLTSELALFVRASTQRGGGDATRVESELAWRDPDLDLHARVRYVAQTGSYRDLALAFTPLDEPLGPYAPYQEVVADVRKGLGEHLSVLAGAGGRVLIRHRDVGPLNHEFTRVFAEIDITSFPIDGFDVSATGSWYRSLGADRDGWIEGSVDLSQRIGDVTLSGGAGYARYRYQPFFLLEGEDVWSAYGRIEWRVQKWLRLRVGYEYEIDDEERFHVVRADVRVDF